jgi:hypothetical protein
MRTVIFKGYPTRGAIYTHAYVQGADMELTPVQGPFRVREVNHSAPICVICPIEGVVKYYYATVDYVQPVVQMNVIVLDPSSFSSTFRTYEN